MISDCANEKVLILKIDTQLNIINFPHIIQYKQYISFFKK